MFVSYIHIEKRKITDKLLGDFVVKSIRNHHLYTLQICMICVAVISMLSSIVTAKTTNYTFAYVLCMCYA